ncbi:hypothetical protein AB3S75_030507 [Citrus x aurantiifolia]
MTSCGKLTQESPSRKLQQGNGVYEMVVDSTREGDCSCHLSAMVFFFN